MSRVAMDNNYQYAVGITDEVEIIIQWDPRTCTLNLKKDGSYAQEKLDDILFQSFKLDKPIFLKHIRIKGDVYDVLCDLSWCWKDSKFTEDRKQNHDRFIKYLLGHVKSVKQEEDRSHDVGLEDSFFIFFKHLKSIGYEINTPEQTAAIRKEFDEAMDTIMWRAPLWQKKD